MTGVSVSAQASGVNAASELTEFVDAITALPGAIVAVAVDVGRSTILDTVAARRGGLSMSGLGATLDVAVTTSTSTNAASTTMQATPAGAWAIVESGTRPHVQRRARGLSVRPYGVFDRVNHPGVGGLHVWDAAVDTAATVIDIEAQRLANQAVSD